MNRKAFDRALVSAVAFGALMLPGAGVAQTATGPEVSIADIIVTAQRREERLQDVPVAVTALSGEALEESGFRSLTDLQYLAPSLQYNPNSNGGFQIRGVGTQGFDYSLDKSVGIMIDGVVMGIARDPGLKSLSDISQVQVLRGPQGTLFGKNTSAGVIVITTRRPELNRLSANAHATYGEDNERLLQANVNVPMSDTMAMRFSIHNQHRDGFGLNPITNEDLGKVDDWGFRAKLLWEPTDDLSIYVIGSYQRTREYSNFLPLRKLSPGSSYAADYAPYNIEIGPRNEDIADDASALSRKRIWGVTTTIDYTIGDHTLTSVTGYRRFRGSDSYTTDSTPVNYLDINQETGKARLFSQELRLTSPDTGFLSYVLGLYYFDSKTAATQDKRGLLGFSPSVINFLQPGALGFSVTGGLDQLGARTKNYAAFGQATLRVAENARVILGGRYTHDNVFSTYDLDRYTNYIPTQAVFPNSARAKASNFSFRVGAQYDFTPDIMGYATYSKGYKGPAVSNLAGEARVIDPEKSDAFEVGLKTALLDRRVTLNIAAFYQKYKGFQAQVYDTTTTPSAYRLGNAGGLESKGVEVEVTARPTQSLTLNGAVSYVPARFTDYITSCYTGQPVSGTPGVDCYLNGNTGAYEQDLKGKPLAGAPDWSFNVGGKYSRPIAEGFLADVSLSYTWRGDAYTIVPDKETTINSYGLLNGNIGVGAEDGRWRIGLYGRNLLNKYYVTGIVSAPFDPFRPPVGATPGYVHFPPADARRTIGIVFDLKLGE